jgi:2-iminobutanoate/2-iminopropanoate deaminase
VLNVPAATITSLAKNTVPFSPNQSSTQVYTPMDVRSEAIQVMKNIEAVLNAAGYDFSHIVKTSIFLADMNDFGTVNEVYAGAFTKDFPARETVQVSVLPKNAKVEISVIAYKE